ncbi:MAG TPA: hypothetical protein VK469_12840, partial [Candidatus Kapabacteria bacterium]|nr:hypothetical protein [Candidatus Kapabacteria bacterium]
DIMEVIEYEQDCIEFIPRVIKHLPVRKQLLMLFDEFDVFDLTEDMKDESISNTMASKQLIPYISDLIEANPG